MINFTDLLDNYLLTLGLHNQAHALHEHDPIRFGQEYRESIKALQVAKDDLNNFFNSLQQTSSSIVLQ